MEDKSCHATPENSPLLSVFLNCFCLFWCQIAWVNTAAQTRFMGGGRGLKPEFVEKCKTRRESIGL